MKLNLGEKIRELRRRADMTQEELASRLGVTYQSVSRWECDVTYPDTELLPEIAGIFSVSMDELFDIPEEKKEDEARKIVDELRREAEKLDVDSARICELIRELRRNYIDTYAMTMFFKICGDHGCFRHPDVLSEVRLTFEAYAPSHSYGDGLEIAIKQMGMIEDDEHLHAFLKRYASETESDVSSRTILLERAMRRGDFDKYDSLRQLALFDTMDNLCDTVNYARGPFLWGNTPQTVDADTLQTLLCANSFQLETLNRFCGIGHDESRPVSGNGQVDFWIQVRLMLGFQRCRFLSALGRIDETFSVLEDSVGLLERGMEITEKTTLTCTSPWLRDVKFSAQEMWFDNGPDGKEERTVYIENETGIYLLDPSNYERWMTDTALFGDAMRDDARFEPLYARVKRLLVYRDGE